MFFPGLTTHQKPVYPQHQMLQQASDKSPLLKDQCYQLPFGQYFSSEMYFSTSEHFLQSSCNDPTELSGVLCHANDLLVYCRDKHKNDDWQKVASRKFQTSGFTLNDKCELKKAADEFCWAHAWQTGILARHRQTENTAYFTSNPIYLIYKKAPV